MDYSQQKFIPKKSLGQNFLIDKNIVKKILQLASLSKEDVVVEVGPGKGVLTEQLLEKAKRVVAIEKDDILFRELQEKFLGNEKILLVHADVLDVDIAKVVKAPFKLVANLPYSVSTKIIQQFLSLYKKPLLLVCMVQKEVGEKLAAKVPHATILSNIIRNFGIMRLAHKVSPNCFRPRPKVDSIVFTLKPRKNEIVPYKDVKIIKTCANRVFSKKKKAYEGFITK